MFRTHNYLGWLTGAHGAAYAAALGLIAIQVGIGIIMKAAQKEGGYEFSPSSSVTISEFFKMLLSTIFFYNECRKRTARNQSPMHTALPSSEKNSFEEVRPFADDEESGESSGHHVAERYSDAQPPMLSLGAYWEYVRNEVSVDTRYGFAQLALFYALINNTIFVSYKLADPGTIQLTKAGVTFITALVMIATLGSKITKIQWIAITIQICGLMVTQYHPESGSAYPLSTYLILIFQVFLSALSGVYNQALLKSGNASLHAGNMMLYASGVAINLILHITIRIFKADEPGFFTGYGSIGAFCVIMSNVFIGLAITAVYKYADAVIKCFATAVATGILLYLSPILFGTEMSFLVLPGTVVVFIASWLYMEGAAPKDTSLSAKEVNEPQKVTIFGKLTAVSKLYRNFVLLTATVFTVIIVAFLTMADSKLPDAHANDKPVEQKVLESPFNNTLAMVRWNSFHPERMPLLRKYDPFFHDLHFSMPQYVAGKPNFHNLTHDSFEGTNVIYLQISRTMQFLLDAHDDDPASEIDGIFYYHFDAWIDPMQFAGADFSNIWFPSIADVAPPDHGGPRFQCMKTPDAYRWWGWSENLQNAAMAAAAVVEHFDLDYKVDTKEWCVGWTDVYYVPKRFFADYIFLSSIFGGFGTFHEIAVPTIIHIIDESRRAHPSRPVMDRFGDCWGSCCASNPTIEDVLWARCGHRLNYLDDHVINAHYDRIDALANILGEPVGPYEKIPHANISEPVNFSAETLGSSVPGQGNENTDNAEAIASANAKMDRLAVEREKNIRKALVGNGPSPPRVSSSSSSKVPAPTANVERRWDYLP